MTIHDPNFTETTYQTVETLPHCHRLVGVDGQTVRMLCHCSQPDQPDVSSSKRSTSTPNVRPSVEPSPAPNPVERSPVVAPNYFGPTVQDRRDERTREHFEYQRQRLESLRHESAWSIGEDPKRDAEIRRLNRIVNRNRS